jgi:NitT/TauT family transport system ATP-binding protein
MAGLLAPSAGSVQVFGQPLTGLNREASYLFQRDGLLPWETTLDNVSLPLRIQGAALAEAREQARHWLDRVGLKGFENHYPAQLSGGMQKRAALAQCLIAQPPILLMDEPFSALDLHLRLRMEEMVLGLWKDLHTTIVFVTHDLDEAISLSDEVVILSTGPGSRVVDQFDIPLPRPRPLLDIRAEPGFQEIYARIWTKLRGEVLNRFAQGL